MKNIPRPFGLAGEYNRRYRLRLARYPAAARAIEEHLHRRGGLALDAGVGRGRLAQLTRSKRLRWIGLDRSTTRLEIAARRGPYQLVRGDLRRLPFAAESFQAVACIQVLEHFDAVESKEITRRLGNLVVPGGLLLISVPVFCAWSLHLKGAADWCLSRLGRGPILGAAHLSHFTLDSALALLPPGFDVIDTQGVRAFSLPFKLLEEYHWWYRLHRKWGRRFPRWTMEVNITAQKKRAAQPVTPRYTEHVRDPAAERRGDAGRSRGSDSRLAPCSARSS